MADGSAGGRAEPPPAGVLVVRDTTEQRRAEEELRDGRARVEQALVATEWALDASVQALSAAVESRDPYTLGHQRRVAALARAIAVDLGMDEERARGLCAAAELHDVGKIHVPIEILSRPGRLGGGVRRRQGARGASSSARRERQGTGGRGPP